MDQDVLDGGDETETRLRDFAVYTKDTAFSIEMMEECCQLVRIFGDTLRSSFFRGSIDELVIVFHLFDQIHFTFFFEAGEIDAGELGIPGDLGFLRLTEEAVNAGIRILDVIDRVIAGLFLGQVDIEVHLGVQCAGTEEIACCIGADFFHQLAQRYGLSGTLGHFDRLSVAEKCHHLEQHDFEIIRVVAQKFHGCLQTDDVAMVIRSPDINELVVAAADLISYIGDIRAEIGRHAIRADNHAVLVIAVLCGAKPESAVLLVHIVFVLQDFERFIHLIRIERSFGEPIVEVDVEFLQILLEVCELFLKAELFEDLQTFFLIHIEVLLAILSQDILRCIDDILSMVAVFRDLGIQTAELEIACIDGFRQMIDLVAGIIHIVFRQYIIAGRAQQIHHRRAIGSASGVSDMEKAGRICRDILNKDAVFFIFRQIPVGRASLQDLLQFAVHCICGKVEIDETGTRDLRPSDQRCVQMLHDGFCDHARCFVRCSRPLHSRIGGIITKFLGFRHFQTLYSRVIALRQFTGSDSCLFRFLNDFFQFFSDFHESSGSSRTSTIISFKWLNRPFSSTS